MSNELNRESNRIRRRARRLLLSLPVLVAAMAFAVLLSPGDARTFECLGDDPSCGGGGGTPPPPPPPGEGGGGTSCSGVVVLYEHTNYQGRCWGFGAGEIAYVGDAASDQASSIWVADGYVATLFAAASFGGAYDNTGTRPDPWSWATVGNDSVSALVVQPDTPDATYYSGAGETEEPTPAEKPIEEPSPTEESSPTEEPAPKDLSSLRAPSSCAKVGAAVTHRNAWRRLWRFALLTRFCWDGTTITAVWEREVAVNIDPLPFALGLIQGWRYSPVAFQQGEAGYASTVLRTDGRFDYCGFRYGCITTQQPWVRIELYRDGRALCMTSARTQLFSCERLS